MIDTSKHGRRYDRQFKADAVAMVKSGRTTTEVAQGLGISESALHDWIKRVHQGRELSEPITMATETTDQREVRRLRQENEFLRRQRDILKKALAIVSENNPASDSR
jgi:transposase